MTISTKASLAGLVMLVLFTAGTVSAFTPRQRIQLRKHALCVANLSVTHPENCPMYGI